MDREAPEPSAPARSAPEAAGGGSRPLVARYGRPPSRSRRLVLIGAAVALLVAAVAWAGMLAARVASEPLQWTDVGFAVRGDDRTDITFDVHFNDDLPRDARAVCTVRALNRTSAEVGLLDVTVGPASRGTIRTTSTIPTSERAVSGLVKACAVE